jgi:signal transduction histidine kinase
VELRDAVKRHLEELEGRVADRTAELATANCALQAQIDERKRVEAELLEVRRRLAEDREAERVDLAQTLHDGAVQDLYGISFQLDLLAQQVQQEGDRMSLAAVQDMLQQTTRILRAACRELRPPTLARFGLEAAIHSHAESFQAAHPELRVHLDLMRDAQALPEPARLALFRVYQEAMSNAARYSRAKHIWVRFELHSERVLLEVRDDGTGFELPKRWVALARNGHLGLLGAMERAEGMNGRLEIETAPGDGTTIRVVAPPPEALA